MVTLGGGLWRALSTDTPSPPEVPGMPSPLDAHPHSLCAVHASTSARHTATRKLRGSAMLAVFAASNSDTVWLPAFGCQAQLHMVPCAGRSHSLGLTAGDRDAGCGASIGCSAAGSLAAGGPLPPPRQLPQRCGTCLTAAAAAAVLRAFDCGPDCERGLRKGAEGGPGHRGGGTAGAALARGPTPQIAQSCAVISRAAMHVGRRRRPAA